MAELLRGKPVAEQLVERTRERVASLEERGIHPRLAILRVGDDEADSAYERGAIKRCEACGIDVVKIELSEGCSQEELDQALCAINEDDDIHGCLMLRPLPEGLSEERAASLLDPAKDVDGMTPGSLYGVLADRDAGFPPCTAQAVLEILDHYRIPLEGARALVIGRSLVIGRPVAALLTSANATTTLAHSRTGDLDGLCQESQIVVVATGKPHTLTASAAHSGLTIVDVGMNWDEQAEAFVGDCDFADLEPRVKAITPVPGGVGAVTTAVLASHVARAAASIADR